MRAKDLIEILQQLPEDTIICETTGEGGCEEYNSAKYFPQFNILYLEPWWRRKSRGYIDMANGDAVFNGSNTRCPFSKDDLLRIRDLARKGKEIVDAKDDGKMHRIQVVQTFAVFEDCNDLALKVDGQYARGNRGEGVKSVICDFEWESLAQD